MKKQAVTLLFLIVWSIFIKVDSTARASTVTYDIGVKVGDWAKYEFSVDWNSSPPQPEPFFVQEARQVNYIYVEVKEISGTNITIQETIYYKNETSATKIYMGDIASYMGNLSLLIIAKNLKEGDKIYESPIAPSINETLPRSYAGFTRMVNRLTVQEGAGILYLIIYNHYWDQETGFLCEMLIEKIETNDYNTTLRIREVMIATNLWEPLIPTWVVPVIFIIIVSIIFIYLIHKKRLKKRLRLRR